MTESKQITSIAIVTFCLSLMWSCCMPLWQFPDEQAHFAQVQDYAELKTVPKGNDTSWEIAESTRILGTLRDEQGHNLYTPIPGYQLPLSTTKYGFAEQYLRNLDIEMRTTMVKQEAPHYPPLYYIVASFMYEQVIGSDIFTRVFFARFMSVILMTFMSLAGYAVARELFPHNHQLKLTTTILISFHPMLMFVGSGVNNDILMNVIGTFLIAKSLAILNRPFTKLDVLEIGGLIVAGVLTKQLVYLLFPSVAIAALISWYRFYKNGKMALLFAGAIAIALSGYLLAAKFNQGFWLPYWPHIQGSPAHFLSSLWFVCMKVYKETFAWYWGVYRWLGLVLPLWLLRVIKVAMAASVCGGCLYLWKNRPQLRQWKFVPWYWILGANLIYIGALIGWEATIRTNLGFGHGIQGRYFFPLISTHMALLVAGWWKLGGKWVDRWFAFGMTLLWIYFNLFSLWYVLGAYYHRFPLSQFVLELSQYKPEYVKWPNLIILGIICVVSLVRLLYTVWFIPTEEFSPKKQG